MTHDALKYLAEESGNVDEGGNFSLGVLRLAVRRSHGIELLSSESPEIATRMHDPTYVFCPTFFFCVNCVSYFGSHGDCCSLRDKICAGFCIKPSM
jgi:hypothetical protein